MCRTYLKTVWAVLPSEYTSSVAGTGACMYDTIVLCKSYRKSTTILSTYCTQDNGTSYVLVSKSYMFLVCIYDSAAGGLGMLGLYPNIHGVSLIDQPLESRVEYCTIIVHVMTEYLSPLLLMSDAAGMGFAIPPCGSSQC